MILIKISSSPPEKKPDLRSRHLDFLVRVLWGSVCGSIWRDEWRGIVDMSRREIEWECDNLLEDRSRLENPSGKKWR